MTRLVLFVVAFLSGFSSLLHESVWIRSLGFILGTSSVSATIVIGAFVGGLGLGAFFLPKRIVCPSQGYALLQILVALFGVLLPLSSVGGAQSLWLGGSSDFVIAFVAVFLPAFLIGGSFPLLFALFPRAMDRKQAALMYGINTMGAVLGAALGGYLGVAALGLLATGILAASMNCLNAGGIFFFVPAQKTTPTDTSHFPSFLANIYPFGLLLFLLGFHTLGFQILVARALMFFFDGFALVYSAVIALFLLGLAIGSFLLARPKKQQGSARGSMGLLFSFIGLSTVACIFLADWLGGISWLWSTPANAYLYYVRIIGISALLVFPATLALGALTPMLFASLPGHAEYRASFITFYSSLGSLFAPILVGQFLLPGIGLPSALLVLSLSMLLPGLYLLFSISRPWLALCSAMPSVALFMSFTSEPFLAKSWILQNKPNLQLLDYADGRDFGVGVVQDNLFGGNTLFTDSFRAAGTGEEFQYMIGLGHLPLLMHKQPQQVAVICFGTGTTAGAVAQHSQVQAIRLVEISPEVVHFAPYYRARNAALYPQGKLDARASFVIDDGRRFLRSSKEMFDVITLEPLLPNTPAAVHFYTQDFYKLAQQRLKPNGILCQWVPTHALPTPDYLSVLKTFFSAFPHGTLWLFDDMTVLLSRVDLQSETEIADQQEHSPLAQFCLRMGYRDLQELIACCLTTGKALQPFLFGYPLVTDNRPAIEWFGFRPDLLAYLPSNLDFLQSLENLPTLDFVSQAARKQKFAFLRARNLMTKQRLAARGMLPPLAESPVPILQKLVHESGALETERWLRRAQALQSMQEGVHFLQQHEFTTAAESFMQGCKIQPSAFELWLGQAAALLAQGKEQSAKNSLLYTLALYPRVCESREWSVMQQFVPQLQSSDPWQEEHRQASTAREMAENFQKEQLASWLDAEDAVTQLAFWLLRTRHLEALRLAILNPTEVPVDVEHIQKFELLMEEINDPLLIAQAADLWIADPRAQVREQAAHLLRLARGHYGFAQLIRLLDDENLAVRRASIVALFQRTGQSFGYDFNFSPNQRRESVLRWKNWMSSQ